jgi:crotonobetaine/carnitine-CoA ligase
VRLKDHGTVTPGALLNYIAGELPRSLVPRYVDLRQDFPRTDTEKIRKAALREEGRNGITPSTWDATTGTKVGENTK